MRLHLVDGTYELFRAHFSKRPDHKTPAGLPAKATLGVLSSLLALLQEAQEGVTHLGVAFDNPIRSFRNELFKDYKSDEGVPEEISAQFDLVEEGVKALGITVWSMKRWEADDALATAAARFRGEVTQVRILTPDKDLGQCLRGTQVVQVDRRQEKEITEASLRQDKGIGPESIPDWLALVGDTADGIPGLPGFGEKSAATLLGYYKKLEAIPRDYALWKVKIRSADKLGATLAAHTAEAKLYRTLATLVEDVPLKESLAALEWRGADKPRFLKFCEKLGTTSLRDRPSRWREG